MTHQLSPAASPGALRFRRAFLLSLALGISVLFFLVIRGFLLAVLLAAVFAGLTSPIYRWLRARLGRRLAGATTVLVLLAGVGLPAAGFLTLVATEAVQVSQAAEQWFREDGRMAQIQALVERIPFAERLFPEGPLVAEQLREAASRTGPFLMGALAAVTRGTLTFFLQTFVLLYALYFFLVDGPATLRGIVRYVPLDPRQKEELLGRFVSVTRATLKGSLLIGLIQGSLAGLAFWVAGVPGPAFWGTVMVVLSILPAIGSAIIWVPAVIYLFLAGEVGAAFALLAWCAIVVSTVDNFLRPRLIGRDARMSDLMVLLSTLGGIVLFGAVGFIVGPIVAALFVTVWHIYGEAFRDMLPDGGELETRDAPSPSAAAAPPKEDWEDASSVVVKPSLTPGSALPAAPGGGPRGGSP